MFRFAHPEYFYLLFLLPVLLAMYIYAALNRKRAISRYGNPELIKRLSPDVSHYKPGVKYLLQCLAVLFLILAIAGPQFGSKLETVKKQGVEVIIALDVSNSMLAQDVSPSRLERSKQILSKLTDQLKNDKVGLIVFAGDAYTQLPITSDYVSAKMFLPTINPSMVPVQGTAIGSAINLAARSFTPNESSSKTIIVITDAENHEDNPKEAAKLALEKGIKVNVVGMGSTQGVPIPVSEGRADFRKDRQGEVIITKLNEVEAQEIAQAGGGIYVRADQTNTALRALSSEIENMAKTELESKQYAEYDEQYQGVLWIVLALLLFDIFVLNRKNSLMKRFDFFS